MPSPTAATFARSCPGAGARPGRPPSSGWSVSPRRTRPRRAPRAPSSARPNAPARARSPAPRSRWRPGARAVARARPPRDEAALYEHRAAMSGGFTGGRARGSSAPPADRSSAASAATSSEWLRRPRCARTARRPAERDRDQPHAPRTRFPANAPSGSAHPPPGRRAIRPRSVSSAILLGAWSSADRTLDRLAAGRASLDREAPPDPARAPSPRATSAPRAPARRRAATAPPPPGSARRPRCRGACGAACRRCRRAGPG